MKKWKIKTIALFFIIFLTIGPFAALIIPIVLQNLPIFNSYYMGTPIPPGSDLSMFSKSQAGSEEMDSYTGSDSGIKLTEYALNSTITNDITVGTDSATVYVNTGDSWTGQQVHSTIDTVRETGQWIPNNNFASSGSGWTFVDTPPNTYAQNDIISRYNNTVDATGDSSGSYEIVVNGSSGQFPDQISLTNNNGELQSSGGELTGDWTRSTWGDAVSPWVSTTSVSGHAGADGDSAYQYRQSSASGSGGEVSHEGGASWRQIIDLYPAAGAVDSLDITRIRINYAVSLRIQLTRGGIFSGSCSSIGSARFWIKFGPGDDSSDLFTVVFEQFSEDNQNSYDSWVDFDTYIDISTAILTGYTKCQIEFGLDYLTYAKSVLWSDCSATVTGYAGEVTCQIDYDENIEAGNIAYAQRPSGENLQNREIVDLDFGMQYRGARFTGATDYYPFVQLVDSGGTASQKWRLVIDGTTDILNLDSNTVSSFQDVTTLSISDMKNWLNSRILAGYDGNFEIRVGIDFPYVDLPQDTELYYYFDDIELNLTLSVKPETVNLRLMDGATPHSYSGSIGSGSVTFTSSYSSSPTFNFATNSSYTVTMNCYLELNQTKTRYLDYNFTAPYGSDYSKVQWWVENPVSSSHVANLYDYEFLISVPNDWIPFKLVKPSSPADTFSLSTNVSNYYYVIDNGATNNSVSVFPGVTNYVSGTPQTGTYQISFLSDNTINQASLGSSIYYLSENTIMNIDTEPNTLGTYSSMIWRIYDENDTAVIESVHNHSQVAGSADFTDNSWTIPSSLSYVGKMRYDVTWNNSIAGSAVTKVGIANVTFQVHVHTTSQVDVEAMQSDYVLDGNIFLQPQYLRFLGNWSTVEGSEKVSGGNMYLNYTDSNGAAQNYTYNTEYDTGNYSVEFNTLLMEGGNQTVQLIFTKKYFEPQVKSLTINQTVDVIYNVITPIDVLGDARYAEVYYTNNYNASLRLYDRYNLSEPITNASAVTISIQNIYNPTDNGIFTHDPTDSERNLWYYEINTNQGRNYLYYEVTIQVDYGDGIPYEINQFNITIKVVWEETIIWWTQAAVTPKGTDGSFYIYAKNATDEMFLEDAEIYLTNITEVSNPIPMTESTHFRVDAEPGDLRYKITVFSNDTNTWPIDTYLLKVEVNKTNHFNHTTQIPYTVRRVTTAATYDPIGLTTFRNPLNITFYYKNIDAGEAGIPGATVQITGSLNENFVEGKNVTIHDEGDGSYTVEINTENCTFNTVYKFNVSISKTDFVTQNLTNITFSFRETDTMLDVDGSTSKLIAIDNNKEFNLTFWYIDIKEAVTIENETGTDNVTLSFDWYTRGSPTEDWTLNSTVNGRTTIIEEDYAGGQNNPWVFSINATGFNISLTYLIAVNASKHGYETAFLNVSVALRKSSSRIGLINPSPTVYNEPVEFYVSYTDELGISVLDPSNFYNVSWRPEGASTWTEIVNSSTTWNWAYANSTPDLSEGDELKIWFNTSCIPFPDTSVGYHYINVSISQGEYEPQSTYFRLYVNPIDAQVFYDPPPIVGIGDWSSFNVYYKDTRNDEFINASIPSPVYIQVDMNDTEAGIQGTEGSDYLVSWLPNSAAYNVSINTSYWNVAGIKNLQIHANWSGAPYYSNQSVSLNILVRNTTSELSYIPYDSIPYGENMHGFKIRFTDLDLQVPIDLNNEPSARILLNNGTEYDITSYLDSSFEDNYNNITFIQTDNLAIGNHILNITVTVDNYNTATRLIPITIRPHYTYLSVSRPYLTPYGDNATVELYWEDLDYNTGINVTNPADFDLSFELGASDWLDDPQKAWWEYGSSNGYYYITVNTSQLGSYGEQDFTVTLNYLGTPMQYQNATSNTTISTRERYTQIYYDLPPIVGIGDWSIFNIYYKDTATGDYINDTIPTPVNIIVDLNDSASGMQGVSGTDYIVAWLPDQAAYNISIDTGYWSQPGIKDIRIFANWSGTPFYDNVSVPISFNVREISSEFTYVPYGSIPFGENMHGFKIRFTDLDSGTPINLATKPTAQVLLNNGTEYDITSTLDSSFDNQYNNITYIQTDNLAIGEHTLNITIVIDNYTTASREIPITIRAHYTYLAVTRPPLTAYGENATVELYWEDLDYNVGINVTDSNDLDLSFILGAEDWLDDPQKAWWEYGSSDGQYSITVNTSQLSEYGDANFQVVLNYIGTNLEYENSTLNTTVSTRERYTQLIYEAPPIVGVGEWCSFNIYYRDIDEDVYINNSLGGQLNILIDLNTSQSGMQGTLGVDYTVQWLPALAAYNVSIDSDYYGGSGTFPVIIYANWTGTPYYDNATVQVNVNIREIASELSYIPYGSIPYHENIYGLKIRFTNLDNGQPIDLNNEPSARIYLNNGTEYDITSYMDSSFENQYNNITYIQTDTLLIGDYTLNITITVDNYVTAERLIPITIRQHYTFLSVSRPPTTPFSDNATCEVTWTDLDYNVGINVTNPFYIKFEMILDSEDWLNDSQKAWWEYGPSDGMYYITVNTSQFSTYGDYNFQVIVSFYGPNAEYQNATMNTTVSTRERYTQLFYDLPPVVGIGDWTSFNVYYKDTSTGDFINSTIPSPLNITVDLNDTMAGIQGVNGTDYLVFWLPNQAAYNVSINTSYWSDTGVKAIRIYANWSGSPFYENSSVPISLNVRAISSEFYYIPYGSIPYGENMHGFYISFTDLDHNIAINLNNEPSTQIILNNGSEYDITSFLDSSFVNDYNNITFIQTDNLEIGDHFLNITIIVDNYMVASRQIPITIRAHYTHLSVSRPPLTAFGENAQIELFWEDLDNGAGINVTTQSDLDLELYYGAEDWLNDPQKAWWEYGSSNGYYYITVNTSQFSTFGDANFQVNLNFIGTHYEYDNATLNTTVSTRERYTQLSYTAPPIVGIGDTTTFNIYYKDIDGDVYVNSSLGGSFNIVIDLNDSASGMQGVAGTDYTITWIPSLAAYEISINTSYWSETGTKDIRVFANWTGSPHYDNATVAITLNVRAIASDFSYVPYDSIPYGDNIHGFKIRFTNLDTGQPVNLNNEPSARILLNNGTEYDITSYLDGSFVDNYNNITFIQTDNLEIGEYTLNITIVIDNFQTASRLIPITIREHYTYLAVTRPPLTAYSDQAVIELFWQDLDYNVGINVTDPTDIDLSLMLGASDWLDDPQKAWWTYGSSNGYYYITVNTSQLSGVGDTNFEVRLNYIGTHLEYQNSSLNTTVSTRARYTQLYNDAPPIVGIGDWSIFSIYYKDIDAGQLINSSLWGALNIFIDLNVSEAGMQGVNGTDYLIEWLPDSASYNVSINTGYWTEAGAMNIRIYANWTGNPHYSNATVPTTINVRYITSELSYIPYGSIPYGDNIEGFQIRFTNIDNGSIVNLYTEPTVTIYVNGTNMTSYLDSSFVDNYNNITFIQTDNLEVGVHYLNITVTVENHATATRIIQITVREHYTYLSASRPPIIAFGNNATVELEWLDLDTNEGINVTNPINFTLAFVLNSEDWLAAGKAWWTYGETNGSYLLTVNTSELSGIGDFAFQARLNYIGTHEEYQNATANTTITTRQRSTLLTHDPYGTPYYGEELQISLNYYDLDDPVESMKSIMDSSTQFDFFGQPGVYEVDSRTIRVVTNEFITQDRLSAHQLIVGLNWTGTSPYYSNQTLNISITCRQIETYRTVFIGNDTAGATETESFSGWPWGAPINFTITFINIDDAAHPAINDSNINVTADGIYADPSNYQVLGWDGSNFVQQYTSTNGTFKISLNTTVANNNELYRFNITLFNSTDPDEPHKNQTFQILVSFRKPVTVLVMEYVPGVYVPWGTNATILAEYQNVEAGNVAISGADVNITVTEILEDGEAVHVKYGFPTLEAYLAHWNWSVDNNVTIVEFLDGSTPKYNITFDTTWCNNTQWSITIQANKTEVSDATSYVTLYIRDILTNLNLISSSAFVVRTDELDRDYEHSDWRNGTKYFNMTVRFTDLDAAAPGYIASNTSDPRYENIQFFYYDYYTGEYSEGVSPDDTDYSVWGMKDLNWHGNFTVNFIGDGKYVITLYCNESLPFHDGLYMLFRVNGTHLRGNTMVEEHAEVSATIKIRIRLHTTGATMDPDYQIAGENIVPNRPGDGVFDAPFDGNITYGEDFNVSVFWFDMNHSLLQVPGKRNQTGVPLAAFANITCDGLFGINGLSSLEGLYYVHNLYNEMSGSAYQSNYTGVYNFEIKTSLMHNYYPYIDLVNGGPNGDGRYNLTINLWFMSEEGIFETEYNYSSVTFEIKIHRINTTLEFQDISYQGVVSTGGSPYVPFGIPGTNFYFNMKLNYTFTESGVGYSSGDPISYAESWSLYFYNSSGQLEEWQLAKARYEPGTPQIIRIYTDTVDTTDHVKLPWNDTGYKNVTLRVRLNKTNYRVGELNVSIFLFKHNTSIVWLPNAENNDFFTQTYNYDEILRYRELELIYFKYIDETAVALNLEIKSITGGSVWNNWSAPISETSISGIYLMNLSASVDVSSVPYYFEVWANDTDPVSYRNVTSVTWRFNCTPANTELGDISWNAPLSGPTIYQLFQQIIFSGTFYNEWGEPLTGTINYVIQSKDTGTVVSAGSIPCVNGNFDMNLLSALVGFGSFNIILTGDAGSNYNTQSITVQITIYPIWSHPVFIVSMIGVAAIAGFVTYRQVKWMMTPYVVKQMIKTRKSIRKGKEIKPSKVVRDRSKLFMDEFKEEWAYLNLKAPEMVSNEIVELARQLSDIKRMRVTTAEAKQLMDDLQNMGLTQADSYLESTMMIPPDARRQILTTVGLIKEEKPEIVAFRELISEIKAEEHTYDEAEDLYNKLKSMKIMDADNYLWKVELIPAEDRIRILDQAGFAVEKLRKKRKKAIPPMSVREIKAELKTIPGLKLEDRQELVQQLKQLDFKSQKKKLDEIKKRKVKVVTPQVEEKAVETPKEEMQKPEIAPMTMEEIDKALNEIKGLSDEDKNLLKDSISILSPEEQRKTIENLRKQYSSNS